MTLQQQIRANRLRSAIAIVGFVLLLLVLAGLVGLVLDISIGVIALVIAVVYGVFALVRSRSLVSRLTHAQEISPEAARRHHR